MESHDQWWRKLTDLRRKQRFELEQWRSRRQEEAEERRRQTTATVVVDESIRSQQIRQWVRNWNHQRHAVQQKLERWKQEKTSSSSSSSSSAAAAAELEKPVHQRPEYDKLMTFLWRTERQAAKEASQSADDFLQRRQRSSSASGRLQMQLRLERHQQWTEERKELLERVRSARTPKALPRAVRIAAAGVCDPQRVLRPTSASIARYLADEDAVVQQVHRPPTNGYVLDIPSRLVALAHHNSHA